MKTTALLVLSVLAMFAIGGCGINPIKEDPAALHGDYSGKDFSGAYAVVRATGNIPGVPASAGKEARWSETEIKQVLYLDADCQVQLFQQLPGWAQAIATESGFGALATAVGEAGFAAMFPGADVVRYFLGGGLLGASIGVNSGRARQESNMKGSMGNCVNFQVREAANRYGILQGIGVIPWYGDGGTKLSPAKNPATAPTLPAVRNFGAPAPSRPN